MATFSTLAHLLLLNDERMADIDVSDLTQDAPLVARLHAQSVPGTQHMYLKETVAEGVGFRDVNTGIAKAASQDESVTVNLKVLDASFADDVALADAHRDGYLAYLQKRTARKVRAAIAATEKQIIYGSGNDANGFVGLIDSAALNALADGMVIEPATPGTTVGGQTSVLLLRTGEEDVSYLLGQDGVIDVKDPVIQDKVVNPGTDNTSYSAYYVAANGWGGLQYGSAWSAARICNVETALTDADLFKAIKLFPAGRKPNLIAMNSDALELLRSSRTATNATGAPAPIPTEIAGIPIIETDNIVNTEAIVV